MNTGVLLIVGLAIALACGAWFIYKILDYFGIDEPTRVAQMNRMKAQVLRMLSPALTLVGVALLVYNLMGSEMYGEGTKVVWAPETRALISLGAVALVAGVLLYRQGK